MSEKQQVISKGPYVHSQINKFLTLKQYIFLRDDGQKSLLLKFVNNTDFSINAVRFKLIQLNSEGSIIDKKNVSFDGISVYPGLAYTPSAAIVVDEKCVDFEVVIDYVDSGSYRYRIKNGRAVAFYNENKVLNSDPIAAGTVLNVKSYRAKSRKYATFIAALIGIVITLFTVLLCVIDIIKDELTVQDHSDKAYVIEEKLLENDTQARE